MFKRWSDASHAARTCAREPSNAIAPSRKTMPHLVATVNCSRRPAIADELLVGERPVPFFCFFCFVLFQAAPPALALQAPAPKAPGRAPPPPNKRKQTETVGMLAKRTTLSHVAGVEEGDAELERARADH